MSRIWYTADLHLGHSRVAESRGFTTTGDHDAAVADAWAETVGPRDQVFVLGDVAMGNPRYALAILKRLPGEKHLIAGNHDACHPMHRDAHRQQRLYLDVLASVQHAGRRRIDRQSVLLSHFPYRGDHTETDRHTQWRLPDMGLALLHGHTHSGGRGAGRVIHVGLDAWGLRPVAQEQVADLLAGAS